MFQLRDYQTDLTGGIHQSWNQGATNVIGVSATGSGKTVMMSKVIIDRNEPTFALAHRQELVSQISLALAKNGVYHSLIASDKTIKFVVNRHVKKTGRNYINTSSPVTVAGVDTLLRREGDFKHVKYWHVDEGHHLLRSNKWGRAVDMFPNARGCGWSATPVRADRKSLHADHGGLYQDLINGPSMRDLINRGFLADYKIAGPEPSINRDNIKISGATGDFGAAALRSAGASSTIVGDVVTHYVRFALGLQTIIFAIDIQAATDIAARLRELGIRAEALSGKTDDRTRAILTDRFENGDLDVLVNVDLFGEGYDVPAVMCVIMGRPTESYGLYSQQFGRMLRPLTGKKHGLLIDAVGNVDTHGLPDAPIDWCLTEPDIKKHRIKPMRACRECFMMWEGFSLTCSHCGHRDKEPPAGGRDLEEIEGDLTMYSPELLEALRAKAAKVMQPIKIRVDSPAKKVIKNNHDARREAGLQLQDAINWWAGMRRDVYAEPVDESYRRFYWHFGTDVLTAQTQKAADMDEMTRKIWEVIENEHTG